MMVDKTGIGPENENVADPGTGEESGDDGPDQDSPVEDKNPGNRTKSNQRWMKLRTTVQLSGAIASTIQKTKPPLKREDSFLKRFSTRQIAETQETVDTGEEGGYMSSCEAGNSVHRCRRHRKHQRLPCTVVNPDENFYYYWLFLLSLCVLYNLWTLIVRQSFPELQEKADSFWFVCDVFSDVVYFMDIGVQFRTGYLEQGLMVYDCKKLARHYICSRAFFLDCASLTPLDLLQFNLGTQPMLRFPRFLKVYRVYIYYYMVESRTVYPNLWRVMNLIHILLILAHWFGCFYFLLSEAEGFQGDWVYPYRPGDYATLTRKYLGSLYWSTLTLTTIGDLPTPETNAEYVFTIVSYLIGVFIFATIVGQVGNVITNRNANRLEFERLLDGAKTYMRHHKVPGGMKRRVLRWYDYSWSRGRIQGGGDINTALGLLPDKLKTELALHVNLSVLKKVTIFQECQPEFLHDLVLKMKAYIFTPGDLICRKGEVAREMFIIADGILEVMSETGRVLTTMKAGDFFGEIGILNLDGLNKRTADVRSVGYSELFSLSREDVLAAMKDYPEAEEILQSLGRKRLMEARNVNRNLKNLDGRSGDKHCARTHSPDVMDRRASKRIVEKLRSDVKGLKNVLRKSRRGTRSKDECLELQPLTNTQSEGNGKGVLSRMPHVWSDETSQEEEPAHEVIGAGLPLLQRLKLLKEKQDAEEAKNTEQKAAASIATVATVTTTTSDRQQKSLSVSSTNVTEEEKKEPEPMHAGLPLLQRLLFLKQKEDKEKLTVQNTAAGTAQVLATTVRTQMKSSPFPKPRKKSKEISKDNTSDQTSDESSVDKAHVSRTDGTEMSHDTGDIDKKNKLTETDNNETNKTVAETITADVSVPSEASTSNSSDIDSSCSSSKGKDQITSVRQLWKFPKKTVGQSAPPDIQSKSKTEIKTVTKLNGSSSGSSSKENKPLSSILNNKIKLQSTEISKTSPLDVSKTKEENIKEDCTLKKDEILTDKKNETSSKQMEIEPIQIAQDKTNIGKFHSASKDSVSSSTTETIKIDKETVSRKESISRSVEKQVTSTKNVSSKSDSLSFQKSKFYESIEDLSPEYSGLPFVKQLKILNERQKLAELENSVYIRSSSLDSGGGPPDSGELSLMLNPANLTRSHSEATAIEVVLRNQQLRAVRENAKIRDDLTKQTSNDSTPPYPNLPSPESNETEERQNLKSILKKLSSSSLLQQKTEISDSRTTTATKSQTEMRRLMRAQTFEGYAARHSKFAKSVTFNRDTLQSPPSDLLQHKDSQLFFSESKQLESLQKRDTDAKKDELDIKEKIGSENRLFSSKSDSSLGSSMPVLYDKSYVSPLNTVDTRQKLKDEEISKTCIQRDLPIIENPILKQKNFLNSGSMLLPTHISQEEEYFGEILGGIKQVIQGHLEEIQCKFKNQFHDLEMEVKKRDDIIMQLQKRIQELEHTSQENGSSSDTSDQPFLRGDSVDTIITSNRRSWEDHSEEESLELIDLPRSMTPTPMWECTKLNIESDSSSSCSSSDSEKYSVYNKNWEVEMLAQELDRREDKSDPKRHSFSTRLTDQTKKCKLIATKSLDEWNDSSETPGRFSSLYRRSMSIGNLHSTLIRGLGNWIWGNAPQTATSSSSVSSIPTISQTCPPASPDI
ncbi:uncharacterized protein LOC142323540 [Lycorma delicatula]|uniref:uncharacterized protein LOC142323540 n=1 Tax=Lycorma delicatula TaxID=130591 RepID=UPI003F512E32